MDITHSTRPAEEESAAPRVPAIRGFLLAFLGPCVIGALLAGFSLLVLYGNQENVGPIDAARIQVERGGLYGSALTYRPYPYKLELYRLTKPDVAIVGSSRAMSFLADGFTASEVTLGGAVNEIADGERLIPEMLAIHKPKLVIFALDFWWFNQARVEDASVISENPNIHFSLSDLVAPYQWIAHGEADIGGLLAAALGSHSGEPFLGAWANQHRSGFDSHGAYYYGAILTGAQKHPDRKFKATLKRLKNGHVDNKTAASAPFSDAAWASLEHIAANLKSAGVEVRFIVPPVAGAVLQAMREGKGMSLLETLRGRLSRSGLAFYDFTDGTSIGTADCEFVDGLHGGFVTYLRIVRAMSAEIESVPALRGLLRPAADLDRLIEANAGRATLRGDAWSGSEIDYLELGCPK